MNEFSISKLLTLVLSSHEIISTILSNGETNHAVTVIIASFKLNEQPKFLEIILDRRISSPEDASKLKVKFFSKTIYAIGYQGEKSIDFIKVFQNNEIKVLIDIRRYHPCKCREEVINILLNLSIY